MVSKTITNDSSNTSNSSKEKGPVDTARIKTKTPLKKDVPGCIQNLGKEMCHRGLSEEAAEIILSSWRQSTKKQYGTYITKWLQFCSEKQINTFQPLLKELIQFLTVLHTSGLGYSAINTAKSAVSSFVNVLSEVQLGNHILVKQFMKGVFHLKPSLPKYNCTWSVQSVLRFLNSLYPLDSISLKYLSMKLVMLLALTTGQRCQTLFLMDLHNIELTTDYVKIRIGDLLKQSKVNRHLSEIYIEAYPINKALCVVDTFIHYVKSTEKLRGNISKLFISVQKPHKEVCQSTISRWIKQTLVEAGIDMNIFSPHSTRSASTSAVATKIPVDTILRTAGWTSDCVFRKFYKRKITNNSCFSNTILDMGSQE